jgi:hypothetical protein
MKKVRIILVIALFFAQTPELSYAVITTDQLQTQQQQLMSAGYQTTQETQSQTQQQALPAINIPGRGYDYPYVIALAPTGAIAEASPTSRGLILTYDTKSKGWAGAAFLYDDASTESIIETADFSSLTNLVVGLRGNSSSVKFEIEDKNKKKAYVILDQVRSDIEQLYAIPLDYFRTQGLDLANVKNINCIIEGNGKSGTLEFNRSTTPMWIEPASLSQASINVPSPALDNPGMMSLAPGSATRSLITGGLHIDYNTASRGWSGAGFSYDDITTTSVEYIDISTLSNLTFNLKGSGTTTARIEIVDTNGVVSYKDISGISSTAKNYSLSLSGFSALDSSAAKASLSRVAAIYVVVNSAADTPKTGNLEIVTVNAPQAGTSAPYRLDAFTSVSLAERGITLRYETRSMGWAGGGFAYDNMMTTNVESFPLQAA